MDSNIIKYRSKHKKCKWCAYYKYNWYWHWTECCYGKCFLKDKIINYENLPRLCKWYKLKENQNEISINKTN